MSDMNANHQPDDEHDFANSQQAYVTLGQFLEDDGWHPQALEENYLYRSMFVGQNGELACFAQIRPDLDQFIFYVVLPVRVPEELRAAVGEFLTRANYGLRIGNFEMDYSDGEVRYKSSIDFEGITLETALVRNVIYPAVQTMDRYLPGMMGVIYGGKTPENAIAEIEED